MWNQHRRTFVRARGMNGCHGNIYLLKEWVAIWLADKRVICKRYPIIDLGVSLFWFGCCYFRSLALCRNKWLCAALALCRDEMSGCVLQWRYKEEDEQQAHVLQLFVWGSVLKKIESNAQLFFLVVWGSACRYRQTVCAVSLTTNLWAWSSSV